ncbi:uncharacterized protein C8R40DRAFT_1177228 [Lentinula edodes]|uniref:uncharacterized protein n=1 Tax=Lentinula edodes TaxID=5353 RepID=UPI001E8DEAF3|nr:uncharacterized protein C8R40DRAFT_1177228 [Lentinula edodes]KAH7868931.1 hypothetical protein C8R40DRAFT_1177228 [Lentinula edodes]
MSISSSALTLLVGFLATRSTILAHPVLLQDSPKQVIPDTSQLTEYLSMPAEYSRPVDTASIFNIPSPEISLMSPVAPIEMIPNIAPSTMSDSSYPDFTTFFNPPALTATGSTESYTTFFDPFNPFSSPDSTPTTTSLSVSSSGGTSIEPPLGPGVVLHSTISVMPYSRNLLSTSTVAFAPTNTRESDPFITHDSETTASAISHRAPIIVGSVLSGLVAFSMITCILINMRRLRCILFARGVHPDPDPRVNNNPEKTSAFPVKAGSKGNTYSDSEQHVSPALPAWMKLPSQISPFHNHRDSLLSYFRLTRDLGNGQQSKLQPQKPQKAKVVDIVTDFPRSRFSVTSSDYTHSMCSVNSDHHLDDTAPSTKSVPLLTPEEFFSLPSSTTIVSRHSRIGSAPVFGHQRREAGFNLAMSRAKHEKSDRKSTTRSRAMSMAVVQNRNLQRRRTKSIAIVENGLRGISLKVLPQCISGEFCTTNLDAQGFDLLIGNQEPKSVVGGGQERPLGRLRNYFQPGNIPPGGMVDELGSDGEEQQKQHN